jgi:SAM-dependent methyltransferase/uncharacterized protein YbaR (Trm112 family)
MASALATELCCVRCQTLTLVAVAQSLQCSNCHTIYPIVHGVPIMFPDVLVEATVPDDLDRVVKAVCDYQGLPQDSTGSTLKAIFSKKYRFSDFQLDVESQQYLDRIYSTQHATVAAVEPVPAQAPPNHKAGLVDALKTTIKPFVPQALRQKIRQLRTAGQPATASSPATAAATIAPLRLKYAWVRDYLPRTMLSNTCFTGNVRLHNCGDVAISSQGSTPVMIAYHWRGKNASQSLPVPEHRTPFPIEIQPGQQITIPMLLETPSKPGQYELQLCLVEEHVCWHEADAITLSIAITTEPQPDRTAQWHKDPTIYSYYDDHHQGVDRLKSQLQTLGTDRPRLLEIGGNASPMLFYDFVGELYNLDIDVHGLQIGQLMDQTVKQNVERIRFICADANAIPFPDDYFDCIMMFASLHHFPDLAITLRSLAQKIQPNGFLAMLCEPVGHYYGAEIDPLFREELLKGVNEQSFSLAEYAAIFEDAGLVADRIMVDGCSLKAFLKKSATPST